ncbi:MAG: hypothetical protein ACRDRT_14865, partial [Pseudonocardiaceae bacterium]
MVYRALRHLEATVLPLAPRFALADFDRIGAHGHPSVVVCGPSCEVRATRVVSVAELELGIDELEPCLSDDNAGDDAGGELLYP